MSWCDEERDFVDEDTVINCGHFDGNCGACEHFHTGMPILDDMIPQEWKPTTEGMKWDCVRCGDCCHRDGNFLELGLEEYVKGLNIFFPAQIVKQLDIMILGGGYISFIGEPDDCQRCLWLEDNDCLIYRNRPLTCRTYPFIIYNALDPVPVLYIDTKCKGLGQGRLIYKDGKLRPDLNDIKTKTIPSLVSQLLESFKLALLLEKHGWLKLLKECKGKPTFEPTLNPIITVREDDGTKHQYNLKPINPNLIAWQERIKELSDRRKNSC